MKDIINQRFIEVVNFLISEKIEIKKGVIAEKLNIKGSKLSEILKKRMNAPIDAIILMSSQYGINLEWLLTGTGEMKKEITQNTGKGHNIVGNANKIKPPQQINDCLDLLEKKEKQLDKILNLLNQKDEQINKLIDKLK